MHSLTVLIVAKTRQGNGACIGAIELESGRSLRLIAADAEFNDRPGLQYAVGDVWRVRIKEPPELIPPHVENVVVYGGEKLQQRVDMMQVILAAMPPVKGGPDMLFGGLLQPTSKGSLYLARRAGMPEQSTTFWQPDRPLVRVVDADHVRIRYRYGAEPDAPTLTYVGFQDPVDAIPAGTLLRVSLAHWWRPDDQPDWEERCFAQLSGWFDIDQVPTDDGKRPLTEQATGINAETTTPSSQPDLPPEAHQTLKRVFGYDDFRPLQTEAIANLLDGQDTLVVLPTGGGKSLCYQLPALLLEGLTVVVSPLISLMQDQVAQLRETGIQAQLLNSTLLYAEQAAVLNHARTGATKLLYMAPETLLKPEVLISLEESRVACLAIDEAHCISAWGHDFRPEYRRLAEVRSRFPDAVCIALTATATPRVQQDIQGSLDFDASACLIGDFDRPNLLLAAQPRIDGAGQLLAFLHRHKEESGIIYCSTRKLVDDVTAMLRREGWSALPYHAGMENRDRIANQERWVRDDVPIMVATVAFGMGIDKSNVRFIVHYNLPTSIEHYYQEIGRAGRDGLPAECLLLYSHQDVSTARYFIDSGAEEERRGRELRLQAMQRFAETDSCRRSVILPYFGGEFEPPCDSCDNCLGEGDDAERTDVTVAAQKFLSCVARTGQRFGIGHVIKVLRGSGEKRVLTLGHDKLSTYGIGMEFSAVEWKELARHFINQGLMEQDMEYGTLRLTARARDVFQGEPVTVVLQQTRQTKQVAAAPMAYDTNLFVELRNLRKELADSAGVPPYVIFSDRSLVEMAAHYPQNEPQLLAMHGVGEAKLHRYGETFLNLIRDYCADHDLTWKPPARRPAVTSSSPRIGKRRFEEVGERFAAGEPLEEIRASYGVKLRTVIGHLNKYIRSGRRLDPDALRAQSSLDSAAQQQVIDAFAELQTEYLTPVFEALNGEVSYDELNIMRMVLVCEGMEG